MIFKKTYYSISEVSKMLNIKETGLNNLIHKGYNQLRKLHVAVT